MKAQHTPNWFIDQYGHVYAMRQPVDGVSTSECLVDGRHSAATVQEKLLIAAAPELLEALKNLAWLKAGDQLGSSDVKAIRAAIAKAKGE